MQELLILKNIPDFELAREQRLLEGRTAIAVAFDVQYKMEREGYPSNPIWEYSKDDELMEVLNSDSEVIKSLWFDFLKKTRFEEYSRVMLFQLILFVDEVLASEFYVRRVLEIESPAAVLNFADKKSVCVERNFKSTVFDDVLETMCARHGIQYKNLARPGVQTEQLDDRVPVWSATLKFSQYVVQSLLSVVFLPIVVVVSLFSRSRIGISYLPPVEEKLRFKWFLKRSKQDFGVRVWPSTHVMLRYFSTRLVLAWMTFKAGRQTAKEFAPLFARFAECRKTSSARPAILADPGLDFYWDHLLQSLVGAVAIEKMAVKLHKLFFKPQYAFFSIPHYPHTIARQILLRKCGVKTFLLPHSTFPYKHKDLYDPYDHLLVTGPYQQRLFEKLGIDENKLFIVEDGYRIVTKGNEPEAEVRKRYSLTAEKIITVVTSDIQSSAGYFPKWEFKVSPSKTFGFLKAISQLGSISEDYDVVIKSHPYSDYYQLYGLLASGNIRHLSKVPISDIIAISDLIVIIAPHSDAIFEAAIAQKPIVYCSASPREDFLDELRNGLIVVDDPEKLCRVVKDIINNKLGVPKSAALVDAFLTYRESHRKGMTIKA